MTRQVIVDGIGLHTGRRARVTMEACPGPVKLACQGVEAAVSALEVVSTARATTVEAHHGRLRIHTVEHALAALGGLGIHDGVRVGVDGPEMPLLDGGSAAWCEALAQLAVHASQPRVRVERAATIDVGPSRYELTPGSAVDVQVHIDFGDPRIAGHARWGGQPEDFRSRIAPARTFARTRDVQELLDNGLVRHVDPASVVVIAPEAIHCAGRPFAADEPARHKLLDLIGDLYIHGGPPLGSVRAFRPGHAANDRALRQARECGVLVQSG